jgi:hypothetical protein
LLQNRPKKASHPSILEKQMNNEAIARLIQLVDLWAETHGITDPELIAKALKGLSIHFDRKAKIVDINTK